MNNKTISVEPMVIVKIERINADRFLVTAYGQQEQVCEMPIGHVLTINMPLTALKGG